MLTMSAFPPKAATYVTRLARLLGANSGHWRLGLDLGK